MIFTKPERKMNNRENEQKIIAVVCVTMMLMIVFGLGVKQLLSLVLV